MSPGAAFRALGFGKSDRAVVVHADDVGMCQATVPAFFDLFAEGGVSSGSTMVPCPWFPEVAERARRAPGVDLGVHLTLSCEWDGYRWGPISTRDPESGLVDEEGYFYRNPSLWRRLDVAAGRREMEAQVERALQAGLDLTHLDAHLFAALDGGLAEAYVELGLARRLPVFLVRQRQWIEKHSAAALDRWEERGMPVFDHLREMPLAEPPAGLVEWTKRLFDELPPGLTYLILHPARDTPELRALASDWRQRVADERVFADPELQRHLRRSGIHVLGWRPLRELLRASLA